MSLSQDVGHEEQMDKRIREIDNRLVYKSDRETLVIEPWGRDGLRVRVTPLPEIIDRPWALTEPVDTQATIEISDAEATISSDIQVCPFVRLTGSVPK